MIPHITMKTVKNTLLRHLPTVLAGGLLMVTISYHWAQANTLPAGEPVATGTDQQQAVQKAAVPEIAQAELKLLLRKPVFGRAQQAARPTVAKQTAPQPKVIPETKLQLKLNGVVAKDDEKLGHAIIDNKEYRVGEAIDQRTSLHAVYTDRVVIQHNNRLEILALPDTNTSSNSKFAQARNRMQKNLANRARKKQEPKN